MPESSIFPLHKAIDRHPLQVAVDTPVLEVLALMQAKESNYVLGVDAQQHLVGVFTDRDAVRLMAAQQPWVRHPLATVLEPNPVSILPGEVTDVAAVLTLLRRHRLRHLPICSANGAVQGIITHESIRRLLNPVDLLRLRRVEEVMTARVVHGLPHTSGVVLAEQMATHRVSCVVIVNPVAEGCLYPIGVVTERHLVALAAQGCPLEQTEASTVMETPLLLISPQETLWQAHALMKQHQSTRLVVVDAQNHLIGIVTQTSLLQVLDPMEAHIAIETLQQLVDERTVSLHRANRQLHKKVTERKRAKAALQLQIKRERLVNSIAQRIRQSLNLDEILQTTVMEVRQLLQVDRAFICQFTAESRHQIAVESVAPGWSLVPVDMTFSELPFMQPAFYQKGRLHSIPDFKSVSLSPAGQALQQRLQMQASLVAPIFAGQTLWGLLVLNQCQAPRYWEKLEVDLLKQLATQVGIAIQQAQLVKALEAANTHLNELANLDGLTQVANRRRFDQCLALEWRRLAREQQPLALILVDVDYFKVYNDTYGHQAGDECLKTVAAALNRAVRRPADLVARYGGEEFVALLPNTPLAGAMCVASQMQAQVQACQIPHGGSSVSDWVTLSMGVASAVPTPGTTPDILLQRADQALYQAKAAGRDRIQASACIQNVEEDCHTNRRCVANKTSAERASKGEENKNPWANSQPKA